MTLIARMREYCHRLRRFPQINIAIHIIIYNLQETNSCYSCNSWQLMAEVGRNEFQKFAAGGVFMKFTIEGRSGGD